MDWFSGLLSYLSEMGVNVGDWLSGLFDLGGDAASVGGDLASAYGPEAAGFLGDVESGLGGAPEYIGSIGDIYGVGAAGGDLGSTAADVMGLGEPAGSLTYGGGMTDIGMGGDFWNTPDLGYTGTTPYYVAAPDYAAAGGGFADAPGMFTQDVANVPGGPTGTSLSDILRSQAGENTPGANWNPQDAVIGTQPFTGLTVGLPESSWEMPDWLKTAAKMAQNFARGAVGGGGGGGGLDPNLLLGRRSGAATQAAPFGTPQYLGVGPVPSGASPVMQLASMGGLPGTPALGQPGPVGGSPTAQGMGAPQMPNLTGQPVGSPNTFGAPQPRNLNPFTPMMIPLPQAPLYQGMPTQPMSGLQRLMMAG